MSDGIASSSEETRLYIDGVWRAGRGGRAQDLVNPATAAVIGRVAHASAWDVDAAVDAAARAFPGWRDTPAERRGELLRRAANALAARAPIVAATLTAEQGKPLVESRAELARAVDTLAWHATAAVEVCAPYAAAGGSATIFPTPLGVVGAFTPWNYPAVIIARKLGAALAAGCTVVLKAAEETPGTAAHLVAALEEAGLPAGVVNLVFGDPPAISAQLLAAPAVQAVSFTGSTAVGKQLAERAGRRLTRCVFELGGHAPVLVCADADVEAAVAAIAAYKFECAGQSCNAPSRVYVEAPRYDAFVDAFTATAGRLQVGDGTCEGTSMGPMANARRLAAMQRLTDDARAHRVRIVMGGERLMGPGYFWSPTVLTGVPDAAAVMTEEPFGPILPIVPVASVDEGVARANATPYGLAAYVFTQSGRRADAAARALVVGSVGINDLRGVPPDVGIAGVRDSGYGYEGGRLGIEAFLNLKVVRGARTGSAERAATGSAPT